MDEDSSSTLSLSFFHKMYTKITAINITRSMRNIEAIYNQLMFNVCGIIVTCICILGMNSNTCYDKGDEQSMKIALNLKKSDEMDFKYDVIEQLKQNNLKMPLHVFQSLCKEKKLEVFIASIYYSETQDNK